jgi:hypothetical protein
MGKIARACAVGKRDKRREFFRFRGDFGPAARQPNNGGVKTGFFLFRLIE